ncbi:hypothetical protein PR202_gb27056 [Eleusine coracana subsp. coracana]|uniref:Rho termination factor-like N-terminal domain-containing protein n=1 Tax=Eleusine coracana subsp. coracana TaxID=191504 RepID=A0AAV5FTD5_ELECO|nr:hypothetical protein PR202_gb27056 [Eleusine coracana subsp. coracana]
MSETEAAAPPSTEQKPRRLRGHKKGAVTCCIASSARPGVVASSGEAPQSKPLETYNYNRDEINQIAVSSKGFLAAADDSGDVKIVSTIQKCLYKRLREAHASLFLSDLSTDLQLRTIRSLEAMDSDTFYLAVITGGLDSKLIAWDFSKGRTLFSIDYGSPELQNGSSSSSAGQCFNPAFVHSVAVSEESTLGGLHKVCAVARGDGAVDVVDLEYELASVKSKGHSRAAGSTMGSKGTDHGDGKSNHSHVKRIHLDYAMSGHTAAVSCVTFSAFGEKGKFLVSGGNDASVKLWDWSKGFSSEPDSNSELVLDINVKKKVKAGSSVFLNEWTGQKQQTTKLSPSEDRKSSSVLWWSKKRNGRHAPAASPNYSKSFAKDLIPRIIFTSQRSDANRVASTRAVRKHSKEEPIAFFRDIQTSIANSSPKTSKRTGQRSSDPFEEVENRKQSYGINEGDGGTDDVTEERRKKTSLDDMTVAELRELARARRMRGYSKLKKGELIDRLKGVS